MATSPGPLQRPRFVFSLDLDQVPSATKRIAKEEPGNQIVSMLHFFLKSFLPHSSGTPGFESKVDTETINSYTL